MDFPTSKSPRRELLGPRPAPLKVRKDTHKFKKPPVAPQPSQPPQPHRPPVIIYTVSPKVIHTNPSDFMTLVQRLTGAGSSSSFQDRNSGTVSPAARYASVEKTKCQEGRKPQGGNTDVVEDTDMLSTDVERITGLFPGILSPGPASLPPIPPNFFSPQSDPNPLGFFHDLSPVLYGNRNYLEGSFMPSPSNFLSPHLVSPTPSLDIFNNFFDI
ncbi:hypothetical protein RJ639_000518 [Escallonia herrerae]|uniref:VQ domain-containing protein n=1 Tax=Escallonia herrerae TaxID=1293975 RepID=A0AA88XG65_9ASTE|nr:hypothetical protein RJ639_000518 [Escallonia herrerae]